MVATSDDQIASQFDLFLRAVAIAALLFAGLELLGGWLLGSLALTLVGASLVVFGGVLLAARQALRHGRAVFACGLASAGFLLAPAIFVAALPALLPSGCFFAIAACSLPMLFRSRRLFVVVAGAGTLVGVFLAVVHVLPPLLPQPAPWVVSALLLSNVPTCMGLMALLFFFIWYNFTASVTATEEANLELRVLQQALADQVRERTSALSSALDEVESRAAAQEALLAENRSQRGIIEELSLPVLPVGAGTLVMPLIGALDAEHLARLLQRVLDAIETSGARKLVLDITGAALVDANGAAGLLRVPQAARLLGCEVVLVGVRPEVAQTIVSLGVDFANFSTASTIKDVLAVPAQAQA